MLENIIDVLLSLSVLLVSITCTNILKHTSATDEKVNKIFSMLDGLEDEK